MLILTTPEKSIRPSSS